MHQPIIPNWSYKAFLFCMNANIIRNLTLHSYIQILTSRVKGSVRIFSLRLPLSATLVYFYSLICVF